MNIEKQKQLIYEYEEKIKKVKQKDHFIDIVDKTVIAIGAAGFVILIINPVGLIPVAIAIASSVYIGKKEEEYTREIYKLIQQKTRCEIDLKKLESDENKEESHIAIIEPTIFSDVNEKQKVLIKTKK